MNSWFKLCCIWCICWTKLLTIFFMFYKNVSKIAIIIITVDIEIQAPVKIQWKSDFGGAYVTGSSKVFTSPLEVTFLSGAYRIYCWHFDSKIVVNWLFFTLSLGSKNLSKLDWCFSILFCVWECFCVILNLSFFNLFAAALNFAFFSVY